MLLTQHIKIYWDKECRGAPYSTIRNQIDKAYSLPKGFFDYNPHGLPSHYMYLIQSKSGFEKRFDRVDTISENKGIRIDAVQILNEIADCEVRYRYCWHRGAIPARKQFDYENGGDVDLDELAMTLKPNEYGRIIYNARYTDFDSGAWYYGLDIINIINNTEQDASLDRFIKNSPDKIYKQIAVLH